MRQSLIIIASLLAIISRVWIRSTPTQYPHPVSWNCTNQDSPHTQNTSCNTSIQHPNGTFANHTINVTNCTYLHYPKVALCNTTNNHSIHVNCTNYTRSHCNLTYITFEREIRGHYNMFNNSMSHFYPTIVNFTSVNNGTNHSNHSNHTNHISLTTAFPNLKEYYKNLRGVRGVGKLDIQRHTNNQSNHSNSSTNITIYTKNCHIESTFLHFRSDYQCYNISEAHRVMHYSDCHRYNWLSWVNDRHIDCHHYAGIPLNNHTNITQGYDMGNYTTYFSH